MKYEEFEFTNSRNQKLHAVQYLPESGQAKAALFWHHGIGEHIGRYAYVLGKFADAGIAVFGYDAHSYGKSEPKTPNERGLVQKFDHLVDDVYEFVDVVKQRQGGVLPPAVFMGGQSLGGLVSTIVVLRQPELWSGLVLHSAAIDVVWTPVLRVQAAVGNVLAALVPRAKMVPAIKLENIHPDPAIVQEYKDDPLNVLGDVRTRTGNESLRGFRYVASRVDKLALPIYACHGDHDLITSLEAVRKLVDGASSKHKKLVVVPGGYHELLIGPERDASLAGILEFLNEVLANRTEGAPLAAAVASEVGPKL